MMDNNYYESGDIIRSAAKETAPNNEVARKPTFPKKPAPPVPGIRENVPKSAEEENKQGPRGIKPKTAPPVPPGGRNGQMARLAVTEPQTSQPPPKPPRLSDTEATMYENASIH